MKHSEWIFIGSSSQCEIQVTGANVSSYHARCRRESEARVRIEDLGSPLGIAVNQPGSLTFSQLLSPNDVVYLGAHPVPASLIFAKLQPAAASVQPPRTHAAAPAASNAGTGKPATREAGGVTSPTELPSAASTTPAASGVPERPPSEVITGQLCVAHGVTVIGRAPDAANKQRIVLNNPLLSRNHAGLLRTENDEYHIWDLGSTYGTFVDSRRVGARRTPVLPGQTVDLAGFRFSLGGAGRVSTPASNYSIGVSVRGVSSEVRSLFSRRLNLEGVSFTVEPKSMLALMGPSGAGKTTLLRIMAGQAAPRSGGVLYNNANLYQHFDQLRTTLGYVPQDDLLHPELTVREALYYAARLRLPPDYTSPEIARRVESIMDRLGIAGQSEIRIGSATKRGISGGQRKRASLAMELLPDPTVLLLDEPTSGLSSADAERVVRSLRDLANEGKTIIVTIHQPSREVFELFDRLAVIDNHTVRTSPAPAPQPGRMIFFGPATAAPAYFQNQDASRASLSRSGADAIFTAIDQNPARKTSDWEAAFRNSPLSKDYVDEHRQPQVAPAVSSARPLPSGVHQFSTLMQRLWKIKTSDPWTLWQMLLIQPLLVGVGIAVASGGIQTVSQYSDLGYIKDFMRVGKTLFFGIFTAIWFGCNNTAREVVSEVSIYQRERMVGLHLGAYIASKMVFFSVTSLVQSLVLAVVESLGSNLRISVGMLILIYWVSSICGAAVGMVLSSLSVEGERAIQLVPLALLPMILFGGGVTRVVELDNNFARQVTTFTPARWAFEGALLAENGNRPMAVKVAGPAKAPATLLATVPARFTLVHHYFEESPHSDSRVWLCVALVALFTLCFVGMAGIALKARDPN